MKKIALYPYDISNLHLLLYKDLLHGVPAGDFLCLTPKGWGYEQEDAGFKIGIHTGITVKSCFEEGIEEADLLVITESILPIPYEEILGKTEDALRKNKEVMVLRKFHLDEERQLWEKAEACNNLRVYFGNKVEAPKEIEPENASMEEIPVPVIMVIGAGERCCKFDIQLELRNTLLKNGYSITQIGTRNYCEIFGFHSFPQFMLDNSTYKESEKVIGFYNYMQSLYKKENPDVFIIGVPGGAFPFDKEFHNQFGITHFLVSHAVLPDYVIFSTLYIDSLPEYLSQARIQLKNRYGYDVDQVFISNYALDYATSKSDQALTYITCKTPSIKEKTRGQKVRNIYDSQDKKDSMGQLIDTLQEYADLTII